MSAVSDAGAAVPGTMRWFRLRPRRAVGAGLVLLAVVAAFLAFGPVGLGDGPLSIPGVGGAMIMTRPAGQSAAYVAELTNSAHAPVHIDSVSVKTSAPSEAPIVLRIRIGHYVGTPCIAVAPLRSLADCVQAKLVPLAGFTVPARANAVTGGRRGPALVIEFTEPKTARCGVITAIVVHYHAGIRHYAATEPQGIVSLCAPVRRGSG